MSIVNELLSDGRCSPGLQCCLLPKGLVVTPETRSRDPLATSTERPRQDHSKTGNRVRARETSIYHGSRKGVLRCAVRFHLREGLRACQGGLVSCGGTCYSTLRLPKPRVWVPVVAMGTGDGVLGSVVMPTLLSRTIAPSLRRFPTLSRSSLAFQRTMIEFKQVRAQKEWKIGDAHRSLRRHRTSELDFSMAKHPAVTHNLVV